MKDKEAAAHQTQGLAAKAGEFLIGNDLRVTRLGFGAMRITGKGIWGEPADRAECIRVLRRAIAVSYTHLRDYPPFANSTKTTRACSGSSVS